MAKVNVLLQEDIVRREQIEEELIKSKEAAESANNAKSTFIYNMSHEFRTPLNGILGYTSLLKDDKRLISGQKEDIQIIQDCGEQLLTLIDDVLDMSKIEAGKLELIPKPFRFPAFLKNVVNFFSLGAKEKGIELVYESPSKLPSIALADPKRLRQILLNLLSNAIKFTHKGQVTFKVSYQHATTSSQEEKNQIRFDVEDSGDGIAAENLEVIFLPFQQLTKQYQQVDGTGLGLSISKTLVEMMGGQLQVQSEPGIGSHFWFEIPLQDYFDTNLQEEEWIDNTSQNSEVVAPQIIPPDVKQIEALFKFARMGNMPGVIEEAEALLENEPNLQAFLQTVCQLAKQYEVYKLKTFLQQYLP
ncbi:ATP-binding protein [Candidatus Marithioploca araucensis]|uniref:histidine kinase n=1 Tax=Candidatus Marithioploca araucensis TaxID=70273 RepID=A0ABT7VSR4_9GAMM|nr:ATP-binding protein [Candidatus Marithioploca araucensis]